VAFSAEDLRDEMLVGRPWPSSLTTMCRRRSRAASLTSTPFTP